MTPLAAMGLLQNPTKLFKLTAVGSLHEVELNAHGPNSVDHNLFVRTIITTSLSV
jgi:hypothetical protein